MFLASPTRSAQRTLCFPLQPFVKWRRTFVERDDRRHPAAVFQPATAAEHVLERNNLGRLDGRRGDAGVEGGGLLLYLVSLSFSAKLAFGKPR